MIVLVTLLVAVLVATLLVGGRALTAGASPDSDTDEFWLVVHTPTWLSGTLRTIDRRLIGGAMAGVAFLVVFASAALVGWMVSGLDDAGGFARWDVSAAEFGRDNATEGSSRILGTITDLGGTVLLVVVLVMLGVYHAVRHSDLGPMWYLGAVGVGVILLNNGLKLIIDRDRPDIAQLAGHAGSSFPSGHSAAAAACWAAIALVVSRRWPSRLRLTAAFVAVFIAGAVAATRVLLGVHWVSDVVAGLVVGWAWFSVVTVVVGGKSLRLGEPARRRASERCSSYGSEDLDSIDGRTMVTSADNRSRS